jgi:hypothetical protein
MTRRIPFPMLVSETGTFVAAIRVAVLARIVPSSVRRRHSIGGQLAPTELTVKTPCCVCEGLFSAVTLLAHGPRQLLPAGRCKKGQRSDGRTRQNSTGGL